MYPAYGPQYCYGSFPYSCYPSYGIPFNGIAPYSLNGSRDSAYNSGFSEGMAKGQMDRRQGLIYNPQRHSRGGNAQYVQGYFDGYDVGYGGY